MLHTLGFSCYTSHPSSLSNKRKSVRCACVLPQQCELNIQTQLCLISENAIKASLHFPRVSLAAWSQRSVQAKQCWKFSSALSWKGSTAWVAGRAGGVWTLRSSLINLTQPLYRYRVGPCFMHCMLAPFIFFFFLCVCFLFCFGGGWGGGSVFFLLFFHHSPSYSLH